VGEDLPGLDGLGPGSVVAGYRIESRLGAGGMAIVYRARDERLRRMVALKVLAPGLGEDEDFRRRFVAESVAAAAVDDPHVIPVYEAGEADGMLFIAMRLVKGIARREGPMPPARVLGLLSPVASALDAAHAAGLVHRDVKPANILVDQRPGRPDHVYLSDFGLSKGAISGTSLTGTGHYLGTPQYSSPEQVQGHPVDGRTDQYALACVACQLLTGRVPFERDDPLAVLFAHASAPPPAVAERRPGLPAAIDPVMSRALAKQPADRYATCRDFTEALRDALGLPPDGTPAAPPSADASTHDVIAPIVHALPGGRPVPALRLRQRPVVLTLVCAVIVAAAVIPLTLISPGGQPAATLTATISAPDSNDIDSAEFTPDGTTLALADKDGSTYLRNTLTGKVTATLTDPDSGGIDSAKNPVFGSPVEFAPDGSAVVIADANGGTYLWNTLTHRVTATLTAPGSDGTNPAEFTPDGGIIAITALNGSSVSLWNASTGKIITTFTDPNTPSVNNPTAFAPDGSILASGGESSTYLWSTRTRKIRAILTDPHSFGVGSVEFAPDGTTLAVGDENGSSYLWNTTTRKITFTLTDPGSQGISTPKFAPDGSTVITSDSDGGVYLWNAATGKLIATLTTPNRHPMASPVFAPDSASVAIPSWNGSVHVWNTSTGKPIATAASPSGKANTPLEFSPNGAMLAIGSGRTYLWNVTTGRLIATVTDPDSKGVKFMAFSPDGASLAIGDGNGRTYLWHISG